MAPSASLAASRRRGADASPAPLGPTPMSFHRPFLPAPLRHAPAVLAALALLLVLAACGPQQEVLERFGVENYIARRTGTEPPEAPPAPAFAKMTALDYEARLRRVTVRVSTFTTLTTTEPKPLLSDAQVSRFRRILARHLRGLRPDQRLRFVFKDRFKSKDVVMDVYKDGAFLAFEFAALARTRDSLGTTGFLARDLVFLAPQPGQEVLERDGRVVLREPVNPDAVALAREAQAKLELLAAAQRENMISAEEADALRELVQRHPGLPIAVWQRFVKKRRLLHDAREAGLIDQDEFRRRLAELEAELNTKLDE